MSRDKLNWHERWIWGMYHADEFARRRRRSYATSYLRAKLAAIKARNAKVH